MKTFKEFLTEAKMTPDEARRILGLGASFSADELKTAYRKASIENHPDRGGSTAKMQDINAAKDTLERLAGATSRAKDYETMRAEHQAKAKIFAQIARDAFMQHIKVDAFTKHFSKVFNDTFTFSGGFENSRLYEGDSVAWAGEWNNRERTTVLSMQVNVYYQDLFNKPVLSAHDAEVGLKLYIHTSILHNRKKVKLTQANYKFTDSYKALSDPEVIFPAKKMNTQAGKAAARDLSKRDIILTFAQELNARGDDEWMYVPVGEYRVALNRHVFLRLGAWSINGVFPTKGGARLAQPTGYTSYLENAEDMNRLWDGLKNIQRVGQKWSPSEIAAALTKMTDEQKRVSAARIGK